MVKKKFKIRMNCISFQDLVILADNKKQARKEAEKAASCPQNDMEFGEFLDVEEGDKVDYEAY